MTQNLLAVRTRRTMGIPVLAAARFTHSTLSPSEKFTSFNHRVRLAGHSPVQPE
ncbi:MAG TPA: hypothetical protein VGM41_10080 [Chitinophagaceae bacterium]|jgi:hypothetical protein